MPILLELRRHARAHKFPDVGRMPTPLEPIACVVTGGFFGGNPRELSFRCKLPLLRGQIPP